MKKSELINLLNEVSEDNLEVVFMVDTDVVCGDEFEAWRGEVRKIRIGICAEYKDEIFMEFSELRERVTEHYEDEFYEEPQKELENKINQKLTELDTADKIIIEIGI